jgi:hypothetical protein
MSMLSRFSNEAQDRSVGRAGSINRRGFMRGIGAAVLTTVGAISMIGLLAGCGGEGQPPTGVTVTVSGTLETINGTLVSSTTIYLISSNGSVLQVPVGANGVYSLSNVAPGAYWVLIPGYLPFQMSISPVNTTLPGITLSPQATYTITGTAGVSGATVTVTNEATGAPAGSTSTTGSNGAFTLNLAPGIYTVTISRNGYHPQTVTIVVPTQTTITVTLQIIPTGSTGASGSSGA